MSTEDGTPASSGLFSNQWMSILVPLAVVTGIGAFAIAFTIVRRRSRRQMLNALYLDNARRAANDTAALEARLTRGHNYGGDAWGASPGTGRRNNGAGAGRWAWIQLGTSRREEGLNELGEAPPPYTGDRRERKEEAVEMGGLNRVDSEEQCEAGRSSDSREANLPPEYTERGSGQAAVAVPSPAVIRGEGASHRYG
jgi:hypothetical protein